MARPESVAAYDQARAEYLSQLDTVRTVIAFHASGMGEVDAALATAQAITTLSREQLADLFQAALIRIDELETP